MSAPNAQVRPYTWGEVVDTLRVTGDEERVTLGAAFIVPGSESVVVGGAPLARAEYQINYQLGTLRINIALPEGTMVIVSYQRQPVMLDPVYSLRPAAVSKPEEPVPPPERTGLPSPDRVETPHNLVFGGTKSVSFSVGSQRGTTLDQSLEATIEGQLTPTIKVKALLSDNNLPVQPQGNTEELQYFDQVFVEVEGPSAKATVGDFAFDNRISSFSNITRQLKGMSGSVWSSQGRVTALGASSKGVFRSITFRGTTGRQGPYELLSAGRNTGEVVIAGTERVYVDGLRMQRGQNRDYVIDYDLGAVIFTPARPITSDSEISVDFEVTQEKYDRSAIIGAAEEVALGRGVLLQVLAAQEADDTDRPKNTTLSDEEKEVLAAAGDDPALAITGGVTAADSGRGEYRLAPPDSVLGLPERFVFDDTTGNYNVSFVEVGVGRGDYKIGGISNAGRRYYAYDPSGNGNYAVGKALPLPERKRLLTARITRGNENERVFFDAEWNVSDFDRNRFSSLDSEDDVGQAGAVRVGVRELPAGNWRLGLNVSGNLLEQEFSSFDRPRTPFYYRDWNLENVPLVGRETVGEVEASIARLRSGGLRYSLSRLDREDIDGVKHEANLTAGASADRRLTARAFDTQVDRPREDRTRRHLTTQAGYGVWKLLPSVVYSTERYRENVAAAPDSGIAYDLVRVGLGNRNPGTFAANISVEQRNTDTVDSTSGDWREARRNRTATATLAARGGGVVQGEVSLVHQEEEAGASKLTSDLARLKSTVRYDPWAIRSDVDYEISRSDARTLARSVVFVGEGKGDYNELGEEVGKGKGSYTLVFVPTADSVPVRTVGLNFRFVWRPGREGSGGGTWAWITRNVSLDQTIGVREESTYEPAWKLYLMFPEALQRDDATVFGTTTIRQDWSFLDGVKNASLTLRYQRQDTEDNRFEGVREEKFFGEHTLRFSRSLSQLLTVTLEGSRKVNRRDGAGLPGGTGSVYDVEARTGLGGLGFRLSGGSSMDADVSLTDQSDRISESSQSILAFSPRLVWRVAEKINVFASYELSQVWNADGVTVVPVIFLAEGTGHRWSAAPNLRISRVISVIATYQGRRETTFSGARITEHELRLETRAYF